MFHFHQQREYSQHLSLNIKFQLQGNSQQENLFLSKLKSEKYFRLCFVKLRLLLLAIQAKQIDGGKAVVIKPRVQKKLMPETWSRVLMVVVVVLELMFDVDIAR